jgi:hypothetical protein
MKRVIASLGLLLVASCNVSRAADTNAAALTRDPAGTLLVIRSLETKDAVTAMYNPKEIDVDKAVPWQTSKKSQGDDPTLEFTAGEPKTLSVDLLFDTFEKQTDVRPFVAGLDKLAAIDPTLKRPPLVELTWGDGLRFRGGVERVRVKYGQFSPNGVPMQAIASVRLRQADAAAARDREAVGAPCRADSDCVSDRCERGQCIPAR